MEKWMPFVTPVCLMVGVLFPDIAKHGVPYVTYVFAFMTFIGALKSRFRDIANVFKRPLPLILMFLVLHILIPVTAYGVGLLFCNYGNQPANGISAGRQYQNYSCYSQTFSIQMLYIGRNLGGIGSHHKNQTHF